MNGKPYRYFDVTIELKAGPTCQGCSAVDHHPELVSIVNSGAADGTRCSHLFVESPAPLEALPGMSHYSPYSSPLRPGKMALVRPPYPLYRHIWTPTIPHISFLPTNPPHVIVTVVLGATSPGGAYHRPLRLPLLPLNFNSGPFPPLCPPIHQCTCRNMWATKELIVRLA